MNPQTASRTALATAMMRSLHTRSDPHRILDDPWGDRLVPQRAREVTYQRARARDPSLPEVADAATMRSAIDAALRSSVAYPNVVLRSRYAEDALHRAVARGVRQYALIGAGFDSYALRIPSAGAGLRVIEIDHPATQAMKRECIAASGAVLPDSVHFVAADLAAEDLPSVLATSAFQASQPAFFSWLGVTMYLTREANLTTLRAIASTAAGGSELVFSYFDAAVFEAPDAELPDGMRVLRDSVAAAGEPFVSGFRPATLEQELMPLGFALLEDVSDADLARRYDPDDLNRFAVGGISRIAHVRVA